MSEKNVLAILADGFEELEAMAPIDILRRIGVAVTIAGLHSKEISSARNVKVITDTDLANLSGDFDAIILPGGGDGAKNLADSEQVKKLILDMYNQGKIVAAICASPTLVLAPTGILDGKKATCYPGLEKYFSTSIIHSTDKVVVDGNIVTSQGPGTALLFGVKLVELLMGIETADSVRKSMLF